MLAVKQTRRSALHPAVRWGACVAAVACLAGCATPGPAGPPQAQAAMAGIGIAITFKPPLAGPSRPADTVYFARLDEQGQLKELYASNFHKDGQVYLLNAPPGRYRAVAGSYGVSVIGPPSTYISYLPQALIEGTEVTARAGTVAYAGTHTVSFALGVCPDSADEQQLFYADVIAPGVPKCGLARMITHALATQRYVIINGQAWASGSQTYHYRGVLVQSQREAADEAAFRQKAQADLQGTAWPGVAAAAASAPAH